jgi:hypothetical protein
MEMKTNSSLAALRFLFKTLTFIVVASVFALFLLAFVSFFTSVFRATSYSAKLSENRAAILIYQSEESYYRTHHRYSSSLKELQIRGWGNISIVVEAPNRYLAAVNGGRNASPLAISHTYAGGPIYLRHIGKRPEPLDFFGETLNSISRVF